MEFSAEQIATLLNGTVLGDPKVKVSYISKIEDGIPGTLTFLGGEKYKIYLKETKASIILISENLVPKDTSDLPTIIIVKDAYTSFNELLRYYNDLKTKKTGIEEPVSISKSAILGEDIYIGAFAYLGNNVTVGNNTKIYPQTYLGDNVKIGANCIIEPGVKIYNDCIIGDNCVIHAGTVIGSDGFGFQPTENGYQKVPQLGNVVIEDDVEIGSNTTIDRATIGTTLIKKGVKLDNLIHIAHNVEIGEHTVMAAQTGIAGSSKLGKWVMIGGQAGIAGHIKIGNKVIIQGQSGVMANIKDEKRVFGYPAIDYIRYQRSIIHFKKLPEIVARIDELEKEIKKDKNN